MPRKRGGAALERTVHVVTLGCAKNGVDSASMEALLVASGYAAVASPEEAAVVVVNTCGFIESARAESLSALRELAARKRPGQVLLAAGCLTQRFGRDVAEQVAGLDGILGTRRWMDIVEVVREARDRKHPTPVYHLPVADAVGGDEHGVPRYNVQGATAYLKIADGCRRRCAFCAIPLIKGPARSRAPEVVVADAVALQDAGVRELILVAQDTTDYGHDLGQSDGLARLLETLVRRVPEIDWIRLLYAYPGAVTRRLIDVMAGSPQIVPYLDLPLQHADARVLHSMRRPANLAWVRRTVERMRRAMPDLAIRSTFIVGYPTEDDAAFRNLLDFVREMQFDRVGAFKYSLEDGTAAEGLGDAVPEEVKQDRWGELMELAQGISLARNHLFVGRTLAVLVEGTGDRVSIGRSYRDAPEVDGLVIVEDEAPVGRLVPVRITGALAYDLVGRRSVDVSGPVG